MIRQRIAILGAGTAGLATAIVLARQGHDITLFEQSPSMSCVGAGILLQPTGMAAFQHLGVLEEALDLGARVTSLQGRLANGSLLVNSAYREAGVDHHGLGLHRATLCHVLMQALKPHDVCWRMGANVESIHDHGDAAEVVYHQHGIEHSAPFDLLLVTNGAKSGLRPDAWVSLDMPYPWGAAWAILPECQTLDTEVLHQFYHGPSRMMGVLPTGAVPENPQQRLSSVFWSLPCAALDSWGETPDPMNAWIAEVQQRWPVAGEWLGSVIHSKEQLLPARYRDVVMNAFGGGRIGILGDAAHAMSPQLGQGVNMALLDAWALGQAMEQASQHENMWQHYHRLRQPSIRFYQLMSRALTPFYQSHSRLLGVVRDIGFPWMYRLPWLRREMAKTVSGIKTGPFSELSLNVIAGRDSTA